MIVTVLAFGALAILPDLPVPGWGHDRYEVSHSLFVNLTLAGGIALALGSSRRLRERLGGPRVLAAAVLAWLSHLLLDSFYAHGQGVAIYWPLSDARLALPVPWFETLRVRPEPLLSLHNLQVGLVELLSYGPLLLIALWIRRRARSLHG